MYSVIGILKKPAQVPTEEFRRWWFGDHVPHVLRIPGLRHYVIYPLDSQFDMATGQWADNESADGIAVLWFDDRQSARDALASSAGQEDRLHFVDWSMKADVYGGEIVVHRSLPAEQMPPASGR